MFDFLSIDQRLELIKNRLTDASVVADKANTSDCTVEGYERTYAYANGYGKSAMMGVIEDIQSILDDMQNERDMLIEQEQQDYESV